jgi:hypothetical protein
LSEQRVKPIGEVLRSPRFQKEVSLLLFFFAAISAIFATVLITAAAPSDEAAVAYALAGVVQAIVYAGLAMLIRRGSVKALMFTAVLFALDTLLILFGSSWEGVGGMLVTRVILIFVLVRYIRRERSNPPEA